MVKTLKNTLSRLLEMDYTTQTYRIFYLIVEYFDGTLHIRTITSAARC